MPPTGKKKKHKRTTGNVWPWYLQALSFVTNFAIGGTRPERYMYLDGRILSIHFMFGIDKESLINLSSGVLLNDEATEFLLSSPDTGKEKRK